LLKPDAAEAGRDAAISCVHSLTLLVTAFLASPALGRGPAARRTAALLSPSPRQRRQGHDGALARILDALAGPGYHTLALRGGALHLPETQPWAALRQGR
jgi:hypothetical protein